MRISYPIFAVFSARMRFRSSFTATARAGICRITATGYKSYSHVRSLLSRIIAVRIIPSGVVAIHSRNYLFIVIGVERAFLATLFCNFVECYQKKMSYMALMHILPNRNKITTPYRIFSGMTGRYRESAQAHLLNRDKRKA